MGRSAVDILELSADEAREQWLTVLSRRPAARGRRQGRFLPVEVVLCCGLFYLLDPHRYGGANIGSAPEQLHRLARALRRSPNSLALKMLNLDGSRRNCARHEPEVFHRFAASPAQFAGVYLTALRVARELGLDEQDVPDVVGSARRLLGQEELGADEIALALEEQRERIGALQEAFGFDESATTRLVEQRVRLGQHRFARAVLDNFGHRCGFCGFSPRPLTGHRLLYASHIKPWRDSTDRERLDPMNGVAACPVHDSAFDTGLLTVNGGLRIHRAAPLRTLLAAEPSSSRYFGERALRSALQVPVDGTPPSTRYLAWHQEHVFCGEARVQGSFYTE